MTQWAVNSFCGILGFLVVLQTQFPFVTEIIEVPIEEMDCVACMISQKSCKEITCAVRADDGHIYDAVALRRWLHSCRVSGRPLCVIPSKPISLVTPVRLRALQDGCPSHDICRTTPPTLLRTIGTQTDVRYACTPPTCVCIRKSRVSIPSSVSAFRGVQKKNM